MKAAWLLEAARLCETRLSDDGKVRINVRPDHDIGTTAAMKTFFDTVHSVTPQVAGAPASITGAGQAILRAFLEASLYTILAIGLIVEFTIGGLSGVTHAVSPSDTQQTDTYYIVAHFHYVLFGGAVFGLFAGFYYWWPKMFGKLLSDMKSIEVGWAYDPGAKQYYFAIIRK